MVKKMIGILLSTLLIALGILGVIMEAVEKLPPELQQPWFTPLLAALAFILLALGWQDELTNGKAGLIDLVKKFFESSVYWKLGLTLLTIILQTIIGFVGLPEVYAIIAKGIMAVLAALELVSAQADFMQRRLLLQYHRTFVDTSHRDAKPFEIM